MRILLRTDALTSALALPASTANAEVMQEVDHHLRATTEWETLFFLLAVAHLYGDCNPAADLVSRQRWPEFRELCALLGIRPRQVPLSPSALALIGTAISAAKKQHARRAQGAAPLVAASAAGGVRISTASAMRVGGNSLAAQRRHRAQLSLHRTSGPPPPSAQPPPLLSPVRSPPATVARRAQAESVLRTVGHPYPVPPRVLPPSLAAAGTSTAASSSSSDASSRVRGGLAVPPQPPPRSTSAFATASKRYSQAQMLNFAAGHPDMAFRADLSNSWAIAEVTEETVSYGINHNTAKMDERAWEFWEHVCPTHGTSPMRSEQDVKDYPARNAHLLAALLMYAFTKTVFGSGLPPRYHSYLRPLGRLHARLQARLQSPRRAPPDVLEPPRASLPRPECAENMKFSMVSSLQRIPADGSVRVGSIRWDDTAHDVFIFRRLTRFMMFTGFRLAEIVGNGSGEIMFLTYGCLFWCVDNVMIAKPSRAQLLGMRPGRDGAVVFPPRSKPDQWGETHCPFPVRLTYETTELNPAAALRDLELNIGGQVTDRDSHPPFGDAAGRAYTHHYLHNLLKLVLAHLYGASDAHLQMDVPGIPPRLSTYGDPSTSG